MRHEEGGSAEGAFCPGGVFELAQLGLNGLSNPHACVCCISSFHSISEIFPSSVGEDIGESVLGFELLIGLIVKYRYTVFQRAYGNESALGKGR